MAASPIRVVPANEASWEDIEAVFGARGDGARCWCQRFKLAPRESFGAVPAEERAHRMRMQTDAGHPDAERTSGLVAYWHDEPAGWCGVEPRSEYFGMLRNQRVPWDGRDEARSDPSVWAVTCFLVRVGYRRRGIASALAVAAVDHARSRGARAVEGYPITTTNLIAGELHVGTPTMFGAGGLVEVSRPTLRRIVMRRDF